jgi:hypothetical protein
MDSVTLNKCLKQCSVTNIYFQGVYSINNFPKINRKYPCFYIVNTDVAGGKGEHWLVLFFISPNYLEIFDSLGQTPYSYNSYLTDFISANKTMKTVYTNKRLQSLKSNVCGAHCLFYSYKKCQKKISLYTLMLRYYMNNTNFNDCNVLNFAKKQFKLSSKTVKQMVKTVPNCSA